MHYLTNELVFPPVATASEDGFLAIGGDLSSDRLVLAYKSGIFPWFEAGDPILWWSPNPRAVLFPERLHIPASLAKQLKRGRFRVSADACFERVIDF